MALIGQAKTDYQREYMRQYRSNTRPESVRPVRPKLLDPVEPWAGELTKTKQVSRQGLPLTNDAGTACYLEWLKK